MILRTRDILLHIEFFCKLVFKKNYPKKESGSCILVMILLVFPPGIAFHAHGSSQRTRRQSISQTPSLTLFRVCRLHWLRRTQILDYLTPHNDVSNLSLHSPALSQLKKLNFQQRAQSK